MCALREWRAPQGQRPTLLQVTSMQLLSTIGKTIRDLLRKRRLGPEWRDALRILANAPHGLTESILLAHGLTAETITSLVRDDLATMQPETMREGGRTIEVVRVKITEAGSRAIEG